mmetsp:Transcript_15981/g.29537  ORF Transcript_15981/g.29537 Transcript_15981/m.29537 type:complete len:206 (+) Transcript_15981:105-722(+)
MHRMLVESALWHACLGHPGQCFLDSLGVGLLSAHETLILVDESMHVDGLCIASKFQASVCQLFRTYLARAINVDQAEQVSGLLCIQINGLEEVLHCWCVKLALELIPRDCAILVKICGLHDLLNVTQHNNILIFLRAFEGRVHKYSCNHVHECKGHKCNVRAEKDCQQWGYVIHKWLHHIIPINATSDHLIQSEKGSCKGSEKLP